MKKSNLLIAGTLVLALAAGATGAYAYFSARTTSNANTFSIAAGSTLGNEATLIDEYTSADNQDLAPGATISKKVAIKSEGDYESYAYIRVEVPMISAKKSGDTSAVLYEAVTPNFNTAAWTRVSYTAGTATSDAVYVYRQTAKLPARATSSYLFTSCTVGDFSELTARFTDAIIVKGCLIQSNQMTTSEADSSAQTLLAGIS